MTADLTRREAADRLLVSVRTIDRLIRNGDLRAYRIGTKMIRIRAADLAKVSKRVTS